MPFSIRSSVRLWEIGSTALLLFASATALRAQAPACPAVEAKSPTQAEIASSENRYSDAEDLYTKALTQSPQDVELSAALVQTLLHEAKLAQASTQAATSLTANPHSAPALTAMAEVQLRQGEPWLARQNADAAIAVDPCYARAHLIRSRLLRINSMYASERAELERAYAIDPTNPDIQQAWLAVDSPAHEIEGIDQSLKTMKDLDADTRKKAEASIRSMMPMLSESSQTCQVLPDVTSATIALQPSFADVKHIDGYRLEAEFSHGKAKLIVDSAASGLYISKALADQNGFKQGEGDPQGTVRADSVHIGPMEFRDCIVGVSETPFSAGADGFIGTDMFAPWLITLDYRLGKMTLAPLPPQATLLPPDRPAPPDSGDWIPAYHRRQYLLLPITFGDKSRRLFILASGMRFSAMTEQTAHSLSKMKVNFTNTEQTAAGGKVQFYREIFDLQLANLPQIHQGHILDFDPSVMDRNAGFQIAGMLGLDVLQTLTLHLDYRDGLVRLDSSAAEGAAGKQTMIASTQTAPQSNISMPDCAVADTRDRSINSTIQARVTGLLDSDHLKPGKEIFVKVVYGLAYPGCTLDEDAILYGHVTEVTSTKRPDSSELALIFDHGDCTGHMKKALTLRLIGLIAPADESSKHMHDALPTEVAGGTRDISITAAESVDGADEDLNPGGAPHTVHPGIVVRMPHAKLEPEGGPGCSARITSTNHNIELGAGSELILTMMGP